MFKKIAGIVLSTALMLTGTVAAQAATPTAAYKTIYEQYNLTTPVAGSVLHIVGTDLDQVTGAYYKAFAPLSYADKPTVVSNQTATSLDVAAVAMPGDNTAELYLTTASGDVLVGYYKAIGSTKITSSVSFRNQVSMPATAHVGDPARDLSEYTNINITNWAVGTAPAEYTTNTEVCVVNNLQLTFVGVGTCTLTAMIPESNGVSASAPITKEIVVGPALTPQTITAPAPNTMLTILGSNFTLNASASSKLPVSYSGSTNSVCRAAGSTVIVLSLGTCTITVTQAGNATFAPATPYVYNITITAKGVPGPKTSPKFPTIGTKLKVKGSLAINLHPTKGTTTAGANVDGLITKITVASSSKSICSATVYKSKAKKVVAVFVKGLKAGKCSLSVAVTGNTMYNSQTKTFAVTVTK